MAARALSGSRGASRLGWWRWGTLLVLALFTAPLASEARTLYLSAQGNDGADGSSWERAWRTPKHAFGQLRAGDELVLADGYYAWGGTVHWKGEPWRPIAIRAQHPGRAVLDGGIRIGDWQETAGLRHTWSAIVPDDRPVLLVSEADTRRVLHQVASPQDCEQRLGCWAFDPEQRRLHLRTSTGLPPEQHRIEVSLEPMGLLIFGPKGTQEPPGQIRISGLVFKNYAKAAVRPNRGEEILIEDCKVLQSGFGLELWYNRKTFVRRCEVWATYYQKSSEAAAIMFHGTNVDSLAENNYVHDAVQDGIRAYGESPGTRFLDNIVVGGRDPMYFKGGPVQGMPDRNLIIGGRWFGRTLANPPSTGANTVVGIEAAPMNPSTRDLIVNEQDVAAARFADPAYLDYRLQSDSPHRATAGGEADRGAFPYRGDVFYVGPSGSDEASGTSVRSAWGTLSHAAAQLRAGQTLYLLPGRYSEPLVLRSGGTRDQPIQIRAHGKGKVVIAPVERGQPGIRLEGAPYVHLENLEVRSTEGAGVALLDSPHCSLRRIVVRESQVGIRARRSPAGTLDHGLLLDNREIGLALESGSSAWTITNTAFARNRQAQVVVSTDSHPEAHLENNAFDLEASRLLGRWGEQGEASTLDSWRELSRQDGDSVAGAISFLDEASGNYDVAPGSLLAGAGWLASTIGPGELDLSPPEPRFEDLKLAHVGARSALITWETPRHELRTMAWYGTDRSLKNTISGPTGTFHSISLSDLEPDTRYFVRVATDWRAPGLPPALDERQPRSMREFGELTRAQETLEERGTFTGISRLIEFRTAKRDGAGRRLFVSSGGSDDADGLSPERAWRTLFKAGREARPGDEVVIEPGVYEETLIPVSGGATAERRIVFRSASWEPVILSGSQRLQRSALRLRGRSHMSFQGFHFKEQGDLASGQVMLEGMNRDIVFRYCLFDGRHGWSGAIRTRPNSNNQATIEDCAFLSNWQAIVWSFGSLTVRHCVFDMGLYSHIYLNHESAELIVDSCVATSASPRKSHSFGHLIVAQQVEKIRSDYNRIYFQPYDENFYLFSWAGRPNPESPHVYQGEDGLERWQRETGNDLHSRIVEDPGFATYRLVLKSEVPDPDKAPFWLDDYRLAEESPLRGAGRDGADVGIRFPTR